MPPKKTPPPPPKPTLPKDPGPVVMPAIEVTHNPLPAEMTATAPPVEGSTSYTRDELQGKAIAAFGITQFKTPGKGWSILGLKLLISADGPEVVGWENLGDETFLPKSHVDALLKVNVARSFLYPDTE